VASSSVWWHHRPRRSRAPRRFNGDPWSSSQGTKPWSSSQGTKWHEDLSGGANTTALIAQLFRHLPSRLPATSQRPLGYFLLSEYSHSQGDRQTRKHFKYFCQEIAFRRNLSSWSAAARSQLEDAHPRVLSVIQWLSQPAFRDGEWSTTTSRQK
jgi:hypothetical protein